MQIDWFSSQNEILINSKYPQAVYDQIYKAVQQEELIKGHICVATSGSTATTEKFPKMVLLAKESLLLSAQAVNAHLDGSSSDCWIHALPDFHVGGIGIWARSFVSGAKVGVFKDKWNPPAFCEFISKQEGTLTALVPTQIFDLVLHQLQAPSSLRAIIVGGGKLNETLYSKARSLGWNVLPSYGLTECASQVATASLDSLKSFSYPFFSLLPHVEAFIQEEKIVLKSGALLSAYLESCQGQVRLRDPKIEGTFRTEDRGKIEGKRLEIFGRDQNFFKISGESVNFANLEKVFEQSKIELQIFFDAAIVAVPDERLGYAIHLVSEVNNQQVINLAEIYNRSVLPYEKIRKIHLIPSLPRSSTGKLLRGILLEIIKV